MRGNLNNSEDSKSENFEFGASEIGGGLVHSGSEYNREGDGNVAESAPSVTTFHVYHYTVH